MADQSILDLTATTTLALTDLIYVAYNVATVPVDRKMTVANFLAYVTNEIGTRYFQLRPFWITEDVATGDNAINIHIPPEFNGWNLTYIHAKVDTAGTTNTTDIQIHNVTDNVDVLSTKLTIDSGETGSDTAATAAVIDTTKDDAATNDVWRVDVDAISTTAPKGLVVTLGFTPA